MAAAEKYNQKQIHIFEGVMSLLREGRQIHELKVADIAVSAGMGKSTAYEYFSSKDEIIREALTYHLTKNFEELISFVFAEQSFEGMLMKALDYLEETLEKRFTGVFLMIITQKHENMKNGAYMDEDIRIKMEEIVLVQMRKAMDIGQSQGIIGKDMMLPEVKMAIYGLYSAYIHELFPLKVQGCFMEPKRIEEYPESIEKITALKERTLKLLIKTLA